MLPYQVYHTTYHPPTPSPNTTTSTTECNRQHGQRLTPVSALLAHSIASQHSLPQCCQRCLGLACARTIWALPPRVLPHRFRCAGSVVSLTPPSLGGGVGRSTWTMMDFCVCSSRSPSRIAACTAAMLSATLACARMVCGSTPKGITSPFALRWLRSVSHTAKLVGV